MNGSSFINSMTLGLAGQGSILGSSINSILANNANEINDSTNLLFNYLYNEEVDYFDGEVIIQVSANSNQNVKLNLSHYSRFARCRVGSVNITSNMNANSAISSFDNGIKTLSTERSKLGAIQNQLEHAYEMTMNTSENLRAAESIIRDTDMAKEMMEFTKSNILMQAAQSMLLQANQQPQGVLQLLA
ncbi:flagellin [Psychrobacillus sp. NPDC096426]|uniref:flagellin n=1 Tax=Psychrobacillus sp. NPDC096426 TaxID=3364491 RepID=UPI0038286679